MQKSQSSRAPKRNGMVLLVEDEHVQAKVFGSRLRNSRLPSSRKGADIDVDIKYSITSAIRAINERRRKGLFYDAIVTDFQVPGGDGCQLTNIVRDAEAEGFKTGNYFPRTPIIAYSSCTPEEIGCWEGIDAFVHKAENQKTTSRKLINALARLLPAIPQPVLKGHILAVDYNGIEDHLSQLNHDPTKVTRTTAAELHNTYGDLFLQGNQITAILMHYDKTQAPQHPEDLSSPTRAAISTTPGLYRGYLQAARIRAIESLTLSQPARIIGVTSQDIHSAEIEKWVQDNNIAAVIQEGTHRHRRTDRHNNTEEYMPDELNLSLQKLVYQ
jgi:CheY-like chemotaxis protein